MYKVIYELYTAKALPSLTLDDMLVTEGVTHKRYRQWLKDNDLPLYPMTSGLCREMSEATGSRLDLVRAFNVDHLEVNAALYTPKRTINTSLLKARAEARRASGDTELDLIMQDLPTDVRHLSAEITRRRADGDSVAHLAHLYNLTVGRISQLDTGGGKRKRLTAEVKRQIRESPLSPAAAAKAFGTTINTIYVIRR